MKNPIKVKQGKQSKARGSRFELKTRADLESNGWIVDKWTNNVEFDTRREVSVKDNYGVPYDKKIIQTGKLIRAKNKWAGPGRPMMMGAGLPDFIALRIKYKLKNVRGINPENNKEYHVQECSLNGIYDIPEVIGVESKINGKLDKEEKEKCTWLLKNNVFSKIFIAYPEKEGRKIIVKYREFVK